jgi:hypothetical protein
MARSKVIEASGALRDAIRARVTAAKAGFLPAVNYSESWPAVTIRFSSFRHCSRSGQFSESNFGVASLKRPDFLNNFQSLVTETSLFMTLERPSARCAPQKSARMRLGKTADVVSSR